ADGGILPDDYDRTRTALASAAERSDAVICSGGVSVGEEDHLKAALVATGELIQWRLYIKPGKPFTWGRVGGPEHERVREAHPLEGEDRVDHRAEAARF